MKKLIVAAAAVASIGWHMGLLGNVDRGASSASLFSVTVGNIYPGSADVIVRNTSRQQVSSAFTHCTFRRLDGSRIESVPVFVANLDPGDTATALARMPNNIRAASVVCV